MNPLFLAATPPRDKIETPLATEEIFPKPAALEGS
jgi:hypothetical protein